MQMRALATFSILVSFAALAAPACGSAKVEEEGKGKDSNAVCSALFGDECGKACSETDDCATGMHCKEGKCHAECGTGHSCSDNKTCSADGRCPGLNLPGLGGQNGNGDGDGDSCVDVTVEFDKEIPNVLLLVDQSGSMCSSLDGKTRWDTVKHVLIGEEGTGDDRGIVGELESEVRFGLTTYAARVRNGTSCNNQGDADGDLVLTPVEVSLALDNYSSIDGAFRDLVVGSGTPTGQAFEAAAEALRADPNPGSKIIVLATDGEPGLYAPSGQVSNTTRCPDASCDVEFHRGCCPGGDCATPVCTSSNSCNVGSSCARSRVVHAVQNAHPDIRTFVISVGSGSVATSHLQEVANVGVGLDPDVDGQDAAPYYTADSQEELVNAFRSIIDGVRSCVFSLDGEVDLAEANRGTVRLNGELLPMDDQDKGWRLNSNSELELLGEACEAIKSGDPDLEIKFPCGVVVIR